MVEVTTDTETVMVEAGQSAIVADENIELVAVEANTPDDTEGTDEDDSDVVPTYVEDENLPIMYSENSHAFELAYTMTTDGIGVFVKSLKGFTPDIQGDEYSKTFYLDNGNMSMEYVVYSKEDVNIVFDAIKYSTELFEIHSLETMVNQDGNTVWAFSYLAKSEDHAVHSYIKKISNDMYLFSLKDSMM